MLLILKGGKREADPQRGRRGEVLGCQWRIPGRGESAGKKSRFKEQMDRRMGSEKEEHPLRRSSSQKTPRNWEGKRKKHHPPNSIKLATGKPCRLPLGVKGILGKRARRGRQTIANDPTEE